MEGVNPLALSFCIIAVLVPSTGIPRNLVTSFCAYNAVEKTNSITTVSKFFMIISFKNMSILQFNLEINPVIG